ncbi:hypothetical protein QYE76_028941 [Lolium multiflorum]|uniref:Uncharacterized protein n=1 Tax=Lolium multiflorum TaxID=4521 RepID=A0AAD8VHT3_LOLMU|nr:hypothetical protein QYE76_028941 [Lolium multiflorum]
MWCGALGPPPPLPYGSVNITIRFGRITRCTPARPLYSDCDAPRDALEHCLGLTHGALELRLGRCRLALDTALIALEYYLGRCRVIRALARVALEPQLGRRHRRVIALDRAPRPRLGDASSPARLRLLRPGHGAPHARPCGDSRPEHAIPLG